jgi:hypothetical protein
MDIAKEIDLIPQDTDFQQAHTVYVLIISMQFSELLTIFIYLGRRRGVAREAMAKKRRKWMT